MQGKQLIYILFGAVGALLMALWTVREHGDQLFAAHAERYLVVATREDGVWTGNTNAPYACGFAVDLHRETFWRVFRKEQELEPFLKNLDRENGSRHTKAYRLIDLRSSALGENGLITPGFIDNHLHLFMGGHLLNGVRLRNAVNRQQFREEIRQYMQRNTAESMDKDLRLHEGDWVTGGEWNDRHEGFNGQLPHRNWIDDLTPKNPAFLVRMDGHSALCNTRCLEIANITRDTPNPVGGTIVRDEDGEPTGVLKDLAINLVQHLAPSATSMRSLNTAMNHVLEYGVTTVFEAGAGPSAELGASWNQVALLERVRRQNKLKVRVLATVDLPTWKRLADTISKRNGNVGDNYLRIGCLKEFVDGSLGSSTALRFEPYHNNGENRGLQVKSKEYFLEQITNAEREKLQVAVHAIGERAVHIMLDVYEQVITESPHGIERDRRWRIEHAQLMEKSDYERFRQLGIIVSMQPAHLIDDSAYADKILGEGSTAARTMFPIRSLRDSGASIVFGSDWMVAPVDVMLSTWSAVTRASPSHPNGYYPEEETVTVEDSLRFYTVDGAKALFMEDKVGQISEGLLADFVLLGDNPFTVKDSMKLKDIQTEMTVVGGKLRHMGKRFKQLFSSLNTE